MTVKLCVQRGGRSETSPSPRVEMPSMRPANARAAHPRTTLVLTVALLLADGGHPRLCHALRHRALPAAPRSAAPAAAAEPSSLHLRGGSEFMSSASVLAQNPDMAKSLMSSKYLSKTRKYGFMVLGLGVLLSALGFVFFFNGALIGTGNLLTIGGVVLIAGHDRAYAFLAQRERTRGSAIFLFGVFLVLRGWPRIGVLVEIFGILNLFGNFLPSLFDILKGIPVVGPAITPILESDAVKHAVSIISRYQ